MKTKNLLRLLILMSVIFTSCDSKDSKKDWEIKIEKDLKAEMGEPDSFEFISHKVVDSIKVGEIIEFQDKNEYFIKSDKSEISRNKERIEELKKDEYISESFIKDAISENEKLKKNVQEAEKKQKNYYECIEKKNLDKDKYVVFVYQYNFRGKNAVGGMVKNTLFVTLDDNKKQLDISEKKGRNYIYEPVQNCRDKFL
mgnify:CR=1 FL=1